MVTKPMYLYGTLKAGSVLAKILMVTKHEINSLLDATGSVLAKILMVTKLCGQMVIY